MIQRKPMQAPRWEAVPLINDEGRTFAYRVERTVASGTQVLPGNAGIYLASKWGAGRLSEEEAKAEAIEHAMELNARKR